MGFLQKLLEAIFGKKKKSNSTSSTSKSEKKHTPKPTPSPPPPVTEESSSDEVSAAETTNTPVVEEEVVVPPVIEETPIPVPEVEEEPEVVVVDATPEEEELPEAPVSAQLIEGAKQYLGTPYLYGGTTPEGFDCSGFVGQAFEHIGMDLPRTSRQQATLGKEIDISEVQTGDLVFFSHSGGRIDHVGIITSEKGQPMKMIHASTSKGVIVSDLENSTYWKPRITHAQRVLS